MNKQVDVCIIGGGAAGIAAALGAVRSGAQVMLIERDIELGGILNQCIHNGFGLQHFNEELTGPAYAERVINELQKTNVEVYLESTVLKITDDRKVHFLNPKEGYVTVEAHAIVLATGCRERTRHQIDLPGKRLSGIMTAGVAQRYLNIEGYLVGKRVFILGSGDIGLIMARRMTLEGAKVLGVAEIMPYSNGINRNIVQCLNDYNIPLYLSHTVTKIMGNDRLVGLTIAKVDDKFNVIEGTEKEFICDTLLLSVGLIPEYNLIKDYIEINPLTNGAIVDDLYQTTSKGIFICGNALHVHDLVDNVSEEGFEAGRAAAIYGFEEDKLIKNVKAGNLVRYTIPNKIRPNKTMEYQFKFRVTRQIENGKIIIKSGAKVLKELKKEHLVPSLMISLKLKLDRNVFDIDEDLIIEVEC